MVKIRNNTATKRADVPFSKQFVDGPAVAAYAFTSNQLSIKFPQFPVLLISCRCEETIRNSLAGLQQFAGVSGKEFILKFSLCSVSMRSFYLGMYQKCA